MQARELAFRYGHVWLGEPPEQAIFLPTGFKEARVGQTEFRLDMLHSICMRLFLPGFADSFGMLGVQFTPVRQNDTLIRVAYNQHVGEAATISGLPEKLADTVLKQAVKELTIKKSLGSGLLVFDRAIYSETDSTPFIFRVLTNGLISLLATGIPKAEDDITHLVNGVIKEVINNTP